MYRTVKDCINHNRSQSEPDLLAAAAAVQGQKMSPQGAATPGREGKTLTSLGGAEVMMTWEQNVRGSVFIISKY